MFAGTAVENQLATIFKLLGAPDERRWPGYERLRAEFERARAKQAAEANKEPSAPMPDPSLNALLDELTGAAARAGHSGQIPPEYLIQRLAPRCAYSSVLHFSPIITTCLFQVLSGYTVVYHILSFQILGWMH